MYITSLGNTEVLHRDSEAALASMVGKGAKAEQKVAALQERLGRTPFREEAAAEQARLPCPWLRM